MQSVLPLFSALALGAAELYQLEGGAERSERSLEARRSDLSVAEAVDWLHNERPEAAAFLQLANTNHRLRKARHYHRGHHTVNGWGRKTDDAMKMLNGMIGETSGKLDYERVRCSTLENKLGSLMESCQQDVATFNAQGAEARAAILSSDTIIESLGAKVPATQAAFENLNRQCTMDEASLKQQLSIAEEDVSLIGKVVGASNCEGASAALLQCDLDDGESFLSFGHSVVRQSVAQLRSKEVQTRVRQILAGVGRSNATAVLVDSGRESMRIEGTRGSAAVSAEELPAFVRPASFLQLGRAADPDTAPLPKELGKLRSKCAMAANPNCKSMNDKFLLMQAEVIDKRKSIKSQMVKEAENCKDQRGNFDAQIVNYQARVKGEQTQLARATQNQNEADEQSRLKAIEHDRLSKDLGHGMQTCAKNIENFENEACSLSKLRLEIFAKDGTEAPFIADCVVSSWVAEECSLKCGGGMQRLTRTITAQPVNGAACPALVMERACNEQACPVDCKTGEWSGWSSCSAVCGGGVKQRTRSTMVKPLNGGEPCGETSVAESCNVQACNADCQLGEWTAWSACSQMCGKGFQFREKPIETATIGTGTCPADNDDSRLEFEFCNAQPCSAPEAGATHQCEAKLDVVLLLDGSGSLGQPGWDAQKKAAATFAKAMVGGDEDVNLAVLLFSGPETVEMLAQCSGESSETPDLERDCGMKWVHRLDSNTDAAASAIEAMVWPGKTTLTSAALSMASAELKYGRRDAQSIVIVFTDGRPMSKSATAQASKHLRENARLMWVPVAGAAPIDDIMMWASEPKADNVLVIEDFETLQQPDTVNQIIVDMCPDLE